MDTSNPTPNAPAFSGEFRHRLEGKRITIPSEWRFEKEVELFMIRKTLKRCISVMTREELDRLKVAATEGMSPEDRSNLLDTFGRRLRQATLDKSGRLTIPEDLRKELSLGSEVWLSGSVDTFSIWNVEDFEADRKAEEARADGLLRKLGI